MGLPEQNLFECTVIEEGQRLSMSIIPGIDAPALKAFRNGTHRFIAPEEGLHRSSCRDGLSSQLLVFISESGERIDPDRGKGLGVV